MYLEAFAARSVVFPELCPDVFEIVVKFLIFVAFAVPSLLLMSHELDEVEIRLIDDECV